jgi:hypothetical protein
LSSGCIARVTRRIFNRRISNGRLKRGARLALGLRLRLTHNLEATFRRRCDFLERIADNA